MCVWPAALLMAIGPLFNSTEHEIYGFWFVDVCFIRADNFPALFGLYFGPIVAIYVCCIVILFLTYNRLKKGFNDILE